MITGLFASSSIASRRERRRLRLPSKRGGAHYLLHPETRITAVK
jgi:hypothetical protein